ncbi:3-hydroxyacyl-CoA dehydrogenase [Diplocarpon rosae]|nr:3-hydroxyacyl-CoA dehydrogenase [Diplocarpon rosae]
MKIEGRTFIVSGGYSIPPAKIQTAADNSPSASGLGRACVEDIAAKGGHAAILDMNEELATEVVAAIGGGKTKFFKTDVLDTESVKSAVEGAVQWISETGKVVGGVIAAAGVSAPAKILDRNLEPFSLSDFDFVMNVNVRGTIDLIRQVLPQIARTTPVGEDGERGVVIMVASSAAFDGQPGQVAYAASKGAIVSLTLPLTRDLARYGIRVVTVAPSLFESRMTSMMSEKVRASLVRVMEFPLRPGKPHEFAQLVTQGIENIMLNGVVLRLDGGMRMPSKM